MRGRRKVKKETVRVVVYNELKKFYEFF